MSDAPIFKDPEDLLYELGITLPEEIDLYAVSEYCCAQVIEKSLSGFEARIMGTSKKAFITVNSSSTTERRRFSIGHELGHWMFDRGKPFFNCSKEDMRKWTLRDLDPEVRANRYAANLIMPKSIFGPRIEGKPITLRTVKELVGPFQTSLTATAIRLVELGSFPSMIVCTVNGKRKWFSRNKIVPESVWPVESLAKGSLAYDVVSVKGEKAGIVSAEDWVTLPNSEEYEVYESSINISPGVVLSLIWWKDEAQISDLID